MVNKINKKDIQIEIHSDYFLDRKKKKIEEHPMYIDWWIHWISASSVEIKYSNDNELLFNHPLVYCNFIIKNKKYRIGFDLWDKYPLYALQKNDSEVIRKWDKCHVKFKTNYFDANSPFRYRAPLGYVLKEKDDGRELAEKAYWTDNIFPAGMPLFFGKYFVNKNYKKFRSKKQVSDVFWSASKKQSFSKIRNQMAQLLVGKYDEIYADGYSNYLSILGKSKLCVDFPSNSRVTFRSSEALAMGALLIGPPHSNIYPNGFKLDDTSIICKEDMSDFLDKISYYLTHHKERNELVKFVMKEWDEKMSPEKLSEYWIKKVIDAI